MRVFRELRRERPFETLRIWTPPDAPRAAVGAEIVIEYAGRVGHPSSYGLLGGRLAEGPTHLDVPHDGPPFPESLAYGDRPALGLPAEYRTAVEIAVPAGLEVRISAHGQASSSRFVFGTLARLLMVFLRDGVPDRDVDVWSAHAEAAEVQRST